MGKILMGLLMALTIAACNGKEGEGYIASQCVNSGGLFVIDTPKNWHVYHSTKLNNDYLTFKHLSTPSDTFSIRIERADWSMRAVKFFVFTYFNGVATFKLYTIPLAKDGKMMFDKQMDNIERFATTFHPSKKQQEFLAQLQENDILGLPDEKKLQGYPDDEISTGYVVEYVTKCRYKLFSYSNPHIHANRFGEAKRLMSFVNYLTDEFGF